MPLPETECIHPFAVRGAGEDYKVVGDLANGTPVLALHDGLGLPHNYIQGFTDLTEKFGVPLILYDCIGCGNPTLLPEIRGDQEFEVSDLLAREPDNLIYHLCLPEFHLLGHSEGGHLAAKSPGEICTSTSRIRKLVIFNTPVSVPRFVEGMAERLLQLPKKIQKILRAHKLSKGPKSPVYYDAVSVVYKRYFCRMEPWPEELREARAL